MGKGNNNGNGNGNHPTTNNQGTINVSNTAFNTMGLEPVKVGFIVAVKDLSDAILNYAQKMLKDPKDAEVSFFPADKKSFEEREGKRSTPYNAYLWISSVSEDVCDSTLSNTSDSAIQVNTVRYSDELRRFMEAFAVDIVDNGKNVGPRLFNEEKSKNYKGIQIDLKKLFKVIFDTNGDEYARRFNTMQKYTDLEIGTILDKRGELIAFEITKKVPNRHSKRGLSPQKIKRL